MHSIRVLRRTLLPRHLRHCMPAGACLQASCPLLTNARSTHEEDAHPHQYSCNVTPTCAFHLLMHRSAICPDWPEPSSPEPSPTARKARSLHPNRGLVSKSAESMSGAGDKPTQLVPLQLMRQQLHDEWSSDPLGSVSLPAMVPRGRHQMYCMSSLHGSPLQARTVSAVSYQLILG